MKGAAGRSVPSVVSTRLTVYGSALRAATASRLGGGLVEEEDLAFALLLQGAGLVVEVVAVGDLLAVHAAQVGGELGAVLLQGGAEVEVLGGAEVPSGDLALDDELDSGALDAARAEVLRHAAPEDGREGVAVEPVEDASGLLGLDEIGVDLAGVVDGLADGVAGDLVEGDPLDLDALVRLEDLEKVPGDGFALAVLVRREDEGVLPLHGGAELAHLRGLLGGHLVERLEVVVDVHREVSPPLFLVLVAECERPLGMRSRM